jgi:hypothetical protein
LLALLGAVAILALLMLRSAGVGAAMPLLGNAFGICPGAWNILGHRGVPDCSSVAMGIMLEMRGVWSMDLQSQSIPVPMVSG